MDDHILPSDLNERVVVSQPGERLKGMLKRHALLPYYSHAS